MADDKKEEPQVNGGDESAPSATTPTKSTPTKAASDSGGEAAAAAAPAAPVNPLRQAGLHHHVVPTERSGAVNVYVQVSTFEFGT